MKYYKYQIEYFDEDRRDKILDYVATYDGNGEEVNDLWAWVSANIGRSYADYIDFLVCEDENGNIEEIYFVDEDGKIDYISNEKTRLEIEIQDEDFKILDKYGFDFEKNISVYLHGIAEEIRTEEKK